MEFIKSTRLINYTAIFLLISGCSKERNFEFCFSSIVEGIIDVSPVEIGNSYVPCGVLSTRGVKDNNYNFEKEIGKWGKMADGYRMELPDSAFLEWGVGEGKMYHKNLQLPPFPRLNPGEKYQVGFVIGYQDCVYVWIKTVQKY